VVLSIFAVISLVVLFKNNQFSNTVLLENLAYDIALSIREAQVYGLSVRETSVGSGVFDAAYGARFSSRAPAPSLLSDQTTFFLFADLNADNQWDPSGAENIQTSRLKQGYVISEICGSATANTCDTVTDDLNIFFKRPDPEAHIFRGDGVAWGYAEIHIISPSGGERKVVVYSTGQISVESVE
jgi:hypothetical protein